ncbi:hypothetical protein [uncultured Duncaniella sp.]|uniref:hypothetical protein n=1 Tax=uncultured Duncaniella sp. TaxID=2768039 RepID=UPI00272BB614|nr:hypothetical protein [uncultured Duncaniella sp.]
MSKELERFRRLAKAWARMEGGTAVIYKKEDGSYGFASISDEIEKPIIDIITPY